VFRVALSGYPVHLGRDTNMSEVRTMFLLGLLVLCATGAFTGLLIAYNSGSGPDYTVTMFGNTLGTLNSLEIFVAGIVLALLFCLSLLMMVGGGMAKRRRRAVRRAERRDAADTRAQRDALAARLDSEQPDIERIEGEKAHEGAGADERGPFTPPEASPTSTASRSW
jgi:hypothetical protein